MPAWPVKERIAAVAVRVQAGLRAFFLLCATQPLLALRPASLCVNARLTCAGSLSAKENVVPIGGAFFCLLLAKLASASLSRQTACDCVACVTVGTALSVVEVGNIEVVDVVGGRRS